MAKIFLYTFAHSYSKVMYYSGTGFSEIQTASIQRTNHVPRIDFATEIIRFQPPISGQRTENVPPKDTE